MRGEGEPDMERLVDAVVDHARRHLAHLEDRTTNRGREIRRGAEDHVRALETAAEELGDARGKAVEASVDLAADREIAEVVDGAFERLLERFVRRVRLSLEELPSRERYADALRTWARQAVRSMTGPAEVFTSPKQREAVYDALLAAEARDFRVVGDRRITSGFVVRDLDGRTLLDRRPDALLEQHAGDLRRLLEGVVPEAPR